MKQMNIVILFALAFGYAHITAKFEPIKGIKTAGAKVGQGFQTAGTAIKGAGNDALIGYYELPSGAKGAIKGVGTGVAGAGAAIGTVVATGGTGMAAAPFAGAAGSAAAGGAFMALDKAGASAAAKKLKKTTNPFNANGSIDQVKLHALAVYMLDNPSVAQQVVDTWDLTDDQTQALQSEINKVSAGQ